MTAVSPVDVAVTAVITGTSASPFDVVTVRLPVSCAKPSRVVVTVTVDSVAGFRFDTRINPLPSIAAMPGSETLTDQPYSGEKLDTCTE